MYICAHGFPGGSLVKNPSAILETLVQSLGWDYRSSGTGSGNAPQYSCWDNPMDGGAWQATVHGFTKSQTELSA